LNAYYVPSTLPGARYAAMYTMGKNIFLLQTILLLSGKKETINQINIEGKQQNALGESKAGKSDEGVLV
jgi:hypothetical protein